MSGKERLRSNWNTYTYRGEKGQRERETGTERERERARDWRLSLTIGTAFLDPVVSVTLNLNQ